MFLARVFESPVSGDTRQDGMVAARVIQQCGHMSSGATCVHCHRLPAIYAQVGGQLVGCVAGQKCKCGCKNVCECGFVLGSVVISLATTATATMASGGGGRVKGPGIPRG